MSDRANGQPLHGTAIVIDGKGVLITGEAGSGKTTLALELIRRARLAGVEAALIADDRVTITAHGGGLQMTCPEPIAGKIEIRGFGIVEASDAFAQRAMLKLLVQLVEPGQAMRFAEGETETISNIAIAVLRLPHGPAPSAAGAVLSALGQPVWV